MDRRLRLALDASHGWYDDMAAVHDLPSTVDRGLWRCLAPPPPLHSAAKTLRPGIGRAQVLRAIDHLPHASVADSFGELDLAADGFRLIIEATWIHHPPLARGPLPDGWSRVRDPSALAAWVAGFGTDGIFDASMLRLPAYTILTREDRGRPAAGFVLHETTEAVSSSNCWWVPGASLDRSELLAVAAAEHPGRALTDYTYGDDLAHAVAHGWAPLGPQRVWLRSEQ